MMWNLSQSMQTAWVCSSKGNVVTSQNTREFFAGNNFYTTAANRMARQLFPDAVTGKDVITCLRNSN